MLRSFGTKNFRCLEDFQIQRLSRVNIFIGDNNTGKTALLEALFGHFSQANAINFGTLKGFRRSSASIDKTFWQEFFTDFDDSKEIHLWSANDSGNECRSKVTVGQEMQIGIPSPPDTGVDEVARRPPIQTRLFRPLQVEYTDGTSTKPQYNEAIFDPRTGGLTNSEKIVSTYPAYYFSTAGPPQPGSVANLLSDLLVNKQEKILVDLVKVIDDRIQDLSVASPKGISEVFVDMGQSRLIPLSLMGSGVIRAIGIACAIPAYAGGSLLVDEVENGIYYKRLGDFWRYIYEVAKRYDVQLFATSHSAECVEIAIKTITPDLTCDDPLHVYRLSKNKRTPMPYERESLQSALEFGAEIR